VTTPLQTTAATRNGKTVLIRPLEPDDKRLIVEALGRMSEQSRYRRFLAPKPDFTAAELSYLTEIDHHDHEALIAIDPESGQAIGVARYVRLVGEPRVAEPAVAVIDDWQRQGVGSVLLQRLVTRAREDGLSHFRATVLRENRPMLELLEKSRLLCSGRRGQRDRRSRSNLSSSGRVCGVNFSMLYGQPLEGSSASRCRQLDRRGNGRGGTTRHQVTPSI
jgi:GNAT superfamily N-acetyltransferase